MYFSEKRTSLPDAARIIATSSFVVQAEDGLFHQRLLAGQILVGENGGFALKIHPGEGISSFKAWKRWEGE